MATQRPEELAAEGDEEEAQEGALRDWVGFAVRAPQRHRLLFFATLVSVLCLVVAAAALIPRVYEVSVKILAQRPLVLTSLVNPNHPSGEADSPTRGVQDMLLRRDSIVAMIKGTNLLDIWEGQRPPILRLKDKIFHSVGSPKSDDDRLRELVGYLQGKLQVQVDDQTIKIALQWDNPQTAYQLVNVAVNNFLEDRSAAELAVLGETVSILDDELKKQSDVVEADLLEVRRLKAKADAAEGLLPATTTTPTPTPTNPTPVPNKPVAVESPTPTGPSVAEQLAAKRAQIKALDEPRQRKLRELYDQLAELKSKYADANPLVIAKEQQIKDASVDPPELAQLKSEEQALLLDKDVTPKTTAVQPHPGQPKSKPQNNGGNTVVVPLVPKEDDPDLAQARARLIAATRKYQEISDRISSARIEIISSQAAFKYRYTIAQPPEVPKKPVKPNVLVILAGGSIFALLLAIGASMARDLLTGRVIEAWQVQRRLKLPVLAQVHVER